ncbi:hypothetical protein AAG906_023375 [Vitis piasezkii]
MGYIYVWEHSGGGRHIDVDWSPNFEDLYSPELDFRIFCMCGGDDHLAWKRPVSLEACRGLRTIGDHLAMDTFMTPEFLSYIQILDCYLRTMCLHVVLYSFRVISRVLHPFCLHYRESRSIDQSDSHQFDSVEMSDELASTLASIQEFMAGVNRRLDQIESSRQNPHPISMVTDETVPHTSQTAQAPRVSLGTPFHPADHYETIPPPTVTVPPPVIPTIEDTRLAEQEARIRLQDGGLTWDDRDGIPVVSLPAKFRMSDIERYSGIGCPKIHLRLYSTIMRAHGIDDAQSVALFPMSLNGAAQRWFASVEPSRLRTWEDVVHEFLTQFAFSVDIDVSRRELEVTRQSPDESISSFVTRWRAKVAGMIDRLKADRSIWFLEPTEEAIARVLWTDATPTPDIKGKKSFGSSSRPREVGVISYQHQRLVHHSPYRPPTIELISFIHDVIAATHPPPRPYAQRPARQFTPLGMTLTRAFEKLRNGGLIVHLAPRPLPHPIPPHFRSHEHCLYHQIQGHDTEHCSALHHAIQDLIDSRLVNLARPSVTTNPLPTHSTHAVPPPPSFQ